MPKIKPVRIKARGNKDRTWRTLPGFGEGIYPVVKTDAMTQPVGRDESGRLFTAPSGGGGTLTEETEVYVLAEGETFDDAPDDADVVFDPWTDDGSEENPDGSGTGTAVTSVAGVTPDENGNVPLTAEDIGAATSSDIPAVFDWARADLPFTEDEISDTISGAGFVVNPTNFTDGKTYFRYHAGSTSFTWTNPNPQKGAVTITAKGYSQYGGTGGTRLLTVYDDGTYGPGLLIVSGGEPQTATVTTDADKTLMYIKGNYDLENWILLDMSVLSIVADYPAPTGTVKTVNGIEPDESGNVEIEIPSGGTSAADHTLGVTGASVGQIARITAVDENGVPTAWEAADMAGGNEWSLINTIVLSEDVSSVEVTEDANGEPFALKSVFITGKTGGATTNASAISGRVGTYDVKGSRYSLLIIPKACPAADSTAIIVGRIDLIGGRIFAISNQFQYSDEQSNGNYGGIAMPSYDFGDAIRNIVLFAGTGSGYGAGTNVEIYGVRA